ncbi:MAG: response regulator, partial [Clostridia bacterium]|nr:response regulator [Clostridia bacterium]
EEAGGKVVHAASAGFVDVNAETRKEIERQNALREALSAAENANRAKTVFLSNMSHEIRTPMNAIIGLDNIALSEEGLPDSTREYLEKIGTSARHLLGIINDILDMSRIESGRMGIKNEEFSFAKTLEQVNTVISGQCREKGVTYTCRISGEIDDYYIGDDMKLRQVMINILGNAVKFTPEGGTVSLLVETIAKMDGRSTLRFTVRDTGIGMSREFLPKLFEPFSQEEVSFTGRFGSTGLGMPITRSIVELMNGHIDVESEKNVGPTFTVTVTLMDSDRKTDMDESGMPRAEDMCVLVIDDDPVVCDHAQRILGQVGITSEKALSGSEAIDMVRMRQVRREPYNLILIDWRMPGMDGIETAKRIRESGIDESTVILLTSYSWDEAGDQAKEAGIDAFVAKPLFAGMIRSEFREVYKRKNVKQTREIADLKGRRVLLAEDVAVNAEIMVMVLGMREMVVEHAENGRIALDMYEQHEPGYYDAILMDMRMPEMDGLEATRRIRASERPDAASIPIIALTANAFDEDVQRSMQAGLNAHLTKPVEPDVLFETLEHLIRP